MVNRSMHNKNDKYRHLIKIFQAGLRAVEPAAAVHKYCRLNGDVFSVDGFDYDLGKFEKIIVLGGGKAAAPMAKAIEEVLGDRIYGGMIIVKYGHLETLQKIAIREAGHPIPDQNGLNGALELYRLACEADEKTLVICLISGGGSALMPLPVSGLTLEDKQEATRLLLASGATIEEMNVIRKHLSVIKGGGLVRAVFPATLVTLILSDVVGDCLDSIASGPCVADTSTFGSCKAILEKYAIKTKLPVAVVQYIESGAAGDVPETLKPGEAFLKQSQHVIIARNFDALLQAKVKAEEDGYTTLLLSSTFAGESRELAAYHVAIAREIEKHGYPLSPPACILSGGETTVKLHGRGKGGRNQEFALAAAIKMAGLNNCAVLCAGTDGTDGPTDAAGALVDETTVQRAEALFIDPQEYLDNNDSYHFFDKLDDLYKIGPTNTNVMDLRIVLVG